jgi:alkylation response protein AidB-like acyl-CoA dehydrogenase
MTPAQLARRFAKLCSEPLPLPGAGATRERHRRLFAAGREDLSLAKLAEAHWDALAILAEAGRDPVPGALYAVWASEAPGHALTLDTSGPIHTLSGTKMFCSGAGLVHRALVTAAGTLLVEVDLTAHPDAIAIDSTAWQTEAFRPTCTSAITFSALPLEADAIVGPTGWYVDRPGFWHGACGPAVCWAGGAAGLLDAALASSRQDAHTLAHLAAMHANVWAMEAAVAQAADEIDHRGHDRTAAQVRALTVRHLVEQACTDTLRRFARAYGPAPLSTNADVARRYAELDLYLRQSHAERDLEALGRTLRPARS